MRTTRCSAATRPGSSAWSSCSKARASRSRRAQPRSSGTSSISRAARSAICCRTGPRRGSTRPFRRPRQPVRRRRRSRGRPALRARMFYRLYGDVFRALPRANTDATVKSIQRHEGCRMNPRDARIALDRRRRRHRLRDREAARERPAPRCSSPILGRSHSTGSPQSCAPDGTKALGIAADVTAEQGSASLVASARESRRQRAHQRRRRQSVRDAR